MDLMRSTQDVADRVRMLELQRWKGLGAQHPLASHNPVAEWLAWASCVPSTEFVPGVEAWRLIQAEQQSDDLEMLRLIRNARMDLGIVPPIVNIGSKIPSEGSVPVEWSANGAVIVETGPYASGGGTDTHFWWVEGDWIYPIKFPRHLPYQYVHWLGATSAFTGKDRYRGYIVSGTGLPGEEGPVSALRWRPRPDGSFVWSDADGLTSFGFGRGYAEEYDGEGHVVGSYPEYFREIGSDVYILPIGAEDQAADITQTDTITTEFSFDTSHTEYSITYDRHEVSFPGDLLRAAGPPIHLGLALAQGMDFGFNPGQINGYQEETVEWGCADYDAVVEGAEDALGDAMEWVEEAGAGDPLDIYDHDGWVAIDTGRSWTPPRIYALARHGMVQLRGKVWLTHFPGTGATIGMPEGLELVDGGYFLVPGSGSEKFYRCFARTTPGHWLEFPDVVAGDMINLNGVSWAL